MKTVLNNKIHAVSKSILILAVSGCALCSQTLLADESNYVDELKAELERLKIDNSNRTVEINELQEKINHLEMLMQRGKGTVKSRDSISNDKQQTQSAQEAKKITVVAQAPAKQESAVVKEAPASRSAQAVYQEQHALFDSKFTLETGITYTRTDRKQLILNGFLALDSIFLGDISVDDVKADILSLDVLGRWGVTPRLQVDVAAPFMFRRTAYLSKNNAGVAVEETVSSDNQLELGDVSVGMYYQLAPETLERPDIVWNLRIKAPTGTDPYGIKSITVADSDGNLTVPERLPSGNGVWAVSTGLSFVKTIDPAIMFASVGLFYNHPEKFSDISSEPGVTVPGEVKLGDSFQYGVGTAFAINETSSISFSFTHRITSRSESRINGGDWVTIIGSEANSANLNIGMTHALSNETSMVVNLGVGLTPDAPDMSIGVKFPHVF